MASADGSIKTLPLRGIKDSPTYLHDGRLLTLEDTVGFFNLVLENQAGREREERSGVFHARAVALKAHAARPAIDRPPGFFFMRTRLRA